MTQTWNADRPLDEQQMRRYEARAARAEEKRNIDAIWRLLGRLQARRKEMLEKRNATYPEDPLRWNAGDLNLMVRVVDLQAQLIRARRRIHEEKVARAEHERTIARDNKLKGPNLYEVARPGRDQEEAARCDDPA